MIAQVTGILASVASDRALVSLPGGGITLEVLLPAYTVARLHGEVGNAITLHTHTFLEGSAQGTSFIPRLAGFLSLDDRRFYALFTTVKGIGNRKALRAMALATAQIAGAIEDRDLALLQSLPEIGKRTAETIVATLRGKTGDFVDVGERFASATSQAPGSKSSGGAGSLAREALNVLVQLGERRQDAALWIDHVLGQDDAPKDVQSVIAEVYRVKSSG